MATKVEVWPKIGETYPDAGGVTITSAGAIVWESKYIEDAIRDGFLLTYDPLGIGEPVDHTSDIPPAPRDATYALVGPVPATLANARKLAAGVGIALADAGPGGLLTITATGPGGTGGAPVDGAYLVSSASAVLTSEQVLTAGAGITLTPGAGVMTIASTATGGPTAPSAPPPNVAASSSLGSPGTYATAQHTHGHGVQGGDTLHALATTTVAGFLSNGDKVKIDALPAAGAAPADAPYLVSSASAGLTAEQVLTAGTGITLTPAAGTLTIASTVAGGAPTDAQYLVSATHAGLSAERVLTAGTGITITPAAGTLTIASTGGPTAPAAAPPNIAAGSSIGTAGSYATAQHTHGHGDQAGGTLHAVAVAAGAAGFLSGSDKTRIDGAVQGPAIATDTALARMDGTTGKLVKSSTATLSDAGLLSTASLSIGGNIAVSGTVDGVDVGNLGAVPFVTIGASSAVANERALTAGAGISITDGGAGGAVTVASTVTVGAPTTAQYLTLAADGTLANERVFAVNALSGLTLTDNGAGSTAILSSAGKLLDSLGSLFDFNPVSMGHDCTIVFNFIGDNPISLPAQATYAWPVGTRFRLLKKNSGKVTISAGAGATANFMMFTNPMSNGAGVSFVTSGPVLMYQDGWAEITKIGTNEWRGYGVFWLTPPI